MASGSEDYWATNERLIAGLMEVIKASVVAGGTMIDALENIKTSTDVLNTVVDKLVLTVAELVGVHEDTTLMIAYSSESWSGSVDDLWILVSSESQKRNMLRIDNDGNNAFKYSRDAGSTIEADIEQGSSATFYDVEGVWLKSWTGPQAWSAYEEWAT